MLIIKIFLSIAEDENAKGRGKHIDVKYKVIKEEMKENKIKIY